MFQNIGNLIKEFYPTFLKGLTATLILAIVGTFVGLLIGIIVSFARRVQIKEHDHIIVKILKRILKAIVAIYVNVFRGTPMMVQAMIIFFGSDLIGIDWLNMPPVWIFNGTFLCGLLVITINTGAYMTEIVKAGLNGIDKGQEEAARSLGMSNRKTMWRIIMPQALKNSLPTILNEFIVNIKDSSVLNVIGLTELYASVGIATNKNYMIVEGMVIIAVIYLVLTLIATFVVKLIERKLEGKKVFINPFVHSRGLKHE